MIDRLLSAFHAIMIISVFGFLWVGAVGMIITKEEGDRKGYRNLSIWMYCNIAYCLGMFIYWLVTGTPPIG